MFAVALLLAALMPGIALAGEPDDKPLAALPSEYAPAVEAAAAQLDVSADELTSASSDQLELLLCSKLDQSTTAEIAAGAKEALANAPDQQLKDLGADQRAEIEARLPSLIEELEAKYCTTSNNADEAVAGGAPAADGSDSGSGGSAASASGSTGSASESGIPVPTRVDTGGGGAADGPLVPLAFGGLFASLFGLFGVGLMRRRHGA